MYFKTSSLEALEQAHACSAKAEDSADAETRHLFERLRDRWLNIAQHFELEELST